jgi:hypothetical protein
MLPTTQRLWLFLYGLLWPWWPGVCFCYLATPRNEVGRAIVTIDDAFDQGWPVMVSDRHFDSFIQFLAVGSAKAAPTTVLGIKRPDQPGIIPILNVIVGAVMDLDLDGVSVIVDRKMITGSFRRIIWATSWAVS